MSDLIIPVIAQSGSEGVLALFGLLIAAVFFVGVPALFLICLIFYFKTKNPGWLIGTLLSGAVAVAPFLLVAFNPNIREAFVEGWREGVGIAPDDGPSGTLDRDVSRIVSSDNRCALTIPQNWSAMRDLNSEATIQVGNGFREEYLIVLIDTDEEYTGSLQEHSDLTSGFIVEGLAGSEDSGPRPLTIGGFPAFQRELRGRISGLNISYLHTSIDGEKGFYQILAWTLTEREDAKFPIYREILDTFEEL